jgi:hypothetical protein
MIEHSMGRILQPSLNLQECPVCGTEWPVDMGQRFSDCKDWVAQTRCRLRHPISFELLLLLNLVSKTCVLAGAYLRELSIAEDMKEGLEVTLPVESR